GGDSRGGRQVRSPRRECRATPTASLRGRSSHTSGSYRSEQWPLRIENGEQSRRFPACPGSTLERDGRPLLHDRGGRAPLVPPWGGRPCAAPLHARPWARRRGGEGRAQDEVALRRAPRAAQPRRAPAPPGERRAPDGHGRRLDGLSPRRPRAAVPPERRPRRGRSDAAPLPRAGGERARLPCARALPRAPRRARAGGRAPAGRSPRALVPAEAALARGIPAARDELRRVRLGGGG